MTEKKKESEDEQPTEVVKTRTLLLVLGGLVVLVAALVVIFSQNGDYTWHDYEFKKITCPDDETTCWSTNIVTNVAVHPITFFYGPREAQDVPVNPYATNSVLGLRGVPGGLFVIAFDNDAPGRVGQAGVQIARVTGDQLLHIPTKAAVWGDDITCEDANESLIVAYITQGERTSVTFNNNCVHLLAAEEDDLLLVADAFSLHLLGVLP